MRDLDGKRALITGGGGGIGRALARALGEAGCEVVLADLDLEQAEAGAEQLRGAGVAASAVTMDVTDEAQIQAAVAGVAADRGPVDILINNAGFVAGGGFLDVGMEAHRRTTEINQTGLMGVTHAMLPGLMERPEAHVVNIVSASAFIGLPFGTSYAASKWGALGFSESLRLELAATGKGHVGVTAVCPSYVETGMFDGARPPRFTRFLTPEKVAAATIRGIRRRTAIVRVPWLVHIGSLSGIVPRRVFDAFARFMGTDRSMASWRGH
jgi:short-subunit dehydrogenase